MYIKSGIKKTMYGIVGTLLFSSAMYQFGRVTQYSKDIVQIITTLDQFDARDTSAINVVSVAVNNVKDKHPFMTDIFSFIDGNFAGDVNEKNQYKSKTIDDPVNESYDKK